jgi:hypothetical protein
VGKLGWESKSGGDVDSGDENKIGLDVLSEGNMAGRGDGLSAKSGIDPDGNDVFIKYLQNVATCV